MKTQINHTRIYLTFLTLSVVVTGLNAVGLFYWDRSIGEPLGHLAAWAIPWIASINAGYCVAMSATLWMRKYRPELGNRMTRILNWVLLPAFFGGTVLGIYGLLKVDKGDESHAA